MADREDIGELRPLDGAVPPNKKQKSSREKKRENKKKRGESKQPLNNFLLVMDKQRRVSTERMSVEDEAKVIFCIKMSLNTAGLHLNKQYFI